MMERDLKPELLTTIWLFVHKNKCAYKNAYIILKLFIVLKN